MTVCEKLFDGYRYKIIKRDRVFLIAIFSNSAYTSGI